MSPTHQTGGRIESAFRTLNRRIHVLRFDYHRAGLAGVGRRLAWAGVAPRRLLYEAEVEIVKLWRLNSLAVKRPLVGYTLRMLERRHLEDLAMCGGEEAPPIELFQQLFNDGARCAGVFHSGRLIGYCWAFSRQYVLTFDNSTISIRLALADGEIALGNGLVEEPYRIRGVFPHLISFLVKHVPAGSKIYAVVDTLNDRSMLSHCRLGFVPEASLRFRNVFFNEHIAVRPSGRQHWDAGARIMDLGRLCPPRRSARLLRMPIAAPVLAQSFEEFNARAADDLFRQSVRRLCGRDAAKGTFVLATLEGQRFVAASIITKCAMPVLGRASYRVTHGPVHVDEAALAHHLSDLAGIRARVDGRPNASDTMLCQQVEQHTTSTLTSR